MMLAVGNGESQLKIQFGCFVKIEKGREKRGLWPSFISKRWRKRDGLSHEPMHMGAGRRVYTSLYL